MWAVAVIMSAFGLSSLRDINEHPEAHPGYIGGRCAVALE